MSPLSKASTLVLRKNLVKMVEEGYKKAKALGIVKSKREKTQPKPPPPQ